jgi:hypothetical protein
VSNVYFDASNNLKFDISDSTGALVQTINLGPSTAIDGIPSFNAAYLGSQATEPTLDGNGDAVASGAMFYNTTSGAMGIYTGSAWTYAALLTSADRTQTGLDRIAVAADLALTDADQQTVAADKALVAADKASVAADLILTTADTVATAADVVITNADVVLTNADVALTNADVVLAEADKVQTGLDRIAVAADLVATNQDTIDTAADLVATNQDTIDTAADVVLTNADVVLAEADKVQTGLDRIAVAADLVLTAADTVATAADVALTNADVILTEADKVQTGLDRAAVAADLVATNQDTIDTAADVTTAAGHVTSAGNAQSAAEAARDATLAALDSFDDRYLGQKASAPALDNDGNALVSGSLYFNSTDNTMKVYDGSAWLAAYASLSGTLLTTNNLSDVLDAAVARTNLGLGTASTTASSAYATAAQGTLATDALPQSGGALTGAVTTNSTVDGRDIATDGAKLDAIEASATADQTDAEIRTAVEAATDSNVFTDADHTKLNAIEALADVTDVTNVTAAGALMDSEVDADIKTLVLPASTTISTFGASLVDDADAATSRTTLDVDQAGTALALAIALG